MYGFLLLVMVGQFFSAQQDFGTEDSYGVSCADIDGDNLHDVIVATEVGVRYYLNALVSFTGPYPASDSSSRVVLAADLNSDNHTDIFVGTPGLDFILLTHGDSLTWQEVFLEGSGPSNAAAFIDYDDDGDLDILVAGSQTWLYRNDVDTFIAAAEYPQAVAVSAADYNNDGFTDFALATTEGIDIYRNSSGGGFVWTTTVVTATPTGIYWVDYNLDSLLDLAVANFEGENILLKQVASGFTERLIDTTVAPTPSVALAAGDFDGEGGLDLLFINDGVPDRVFTGPSPGDSTFTYAGQISQGSSLGRAVALMELDGDNGIDAVVVGSDGNAKYLNTVSRDDRIIFTLRGRGDVDPELSPVIAAGARIGFYEDGVMTGFWEIAAGSGHAGQDAPQKSFPYSSAADSLLLVAHWPYSGVIDSLYLSKTLAILDVPEDTTPPLPPTNLVSSSHDPAVWSNERDVTFSWTPGSDPHGSGLAGYSYVWAKNTQVQPDSEVDISDTASTGETIPVQTCEGDSCYFLISSVDKVGNISETASFGPLKLDFTPPVVTLSNPPNDTFLNDRFVNYTWSGIDPPPAGGGAKSEIAAYRLQVSTHYRFFADAIVEDTILSADSSRYQSQKALDDSVYYWRLTSVDGAGNITVVPPQDTDTLGLRFTIDTKSPSVIFYHPDGSHPVGIDTKIRVEFSEQMYEAEPSEDDLSVTHPRHYKVIQDNDTLGFSSIIYDSDVFDVVLTPDQHFLPAKQIEVRVEQSLQDRAANKLEKAVSWSFETEEAGDTLGPEIEVVTIDPNPTNGEKLIDIQVTANDAFTGGSPVRWCFYRTLVEGYDSWREMRREISPDPQIGYFRDSLDLDSMGIASTSDNYILEFQAFDLDSNPSDLRMDTMRVTQPADPPTVTVTVLNDTTTEKLSNGDSLRLRIESDRPVFNHRIEFANAAAGYSSGELVFDSSEPPVFIKVLEGIPAGVITGLVSVEDSSTLQGSASFPFTIEASMLSKSKTFAAPNPARDVLGIYFTPGKDVVNAELRVYSIDGQLVWSPDPITDARVGQRYSFDTDVSDWASGLYMFALRAEDETGERAVVKKVFAVIR